METLTSVGLMMIAQVRW